jgi:hypothetical protein
MDDPAVPLEALLDAPAMARRLARALPGAPVGTLSVRRASYRPGRRAAVRYAAPGAELVALVDVRRDLRGAVEAAADPAVGYDPELDAMLARAPADPWMPVLARHDALRACARAGGATIADDAEPRLLHFLPGERGVVRVGPRVLKAYARREPFEAASEALGLMSAQRAVPIARHVASVEAHRVTVQEALPGEPATSALAVAARAGELARRLHALPLAPARRLPPDALVARASRRGALIAALVARLSRRVERLLARLEATIPAVEPAVAHGGFHHRQLLFDGERAHVIDVDGLCLAAPAFDLATFAAGAIVGAEDDVARVRTVVDALLSGYGTRPPALEWHLGVAALRRTAYPFTHYSGEGFGGRIERRLATAEALAA